MKSIQNNSFLYEQRLTDKLLLNILKKCRPYLKQLSIEGTYRLTAAGISNISQCHNIQDLNLSDCKHLLV